MSNDKKVTAETTPAKVKEQGSGEYMRIQLMKGWDNPKTGMLPETIVTHVLQKWNTGKTKINDLYFQANKLRKDEGTSSKYGDLKIRDYVKRIEDATGVTEKKEQEKKKIDEVKAKEKKEKEEKVKNTEEKKAA